MYRHLLLPTDGSAPSMRATRLAIRLAKGWRARITALHVIPPFMQVYTGDYVTAAANYPELYSPAAYERLTRARAARMLAKVSRSAAAAKVKCEVAIVFAD